MLFAVQFSDKAESFTLRQQYLEAHLAWLDQHKDIVLLGGSLRIAEEMAPVGGLWIVEAPSTQAIKALLATDPFWICGLRQGVDIFHWSKAFANRKVWI